MWLVEDSPLHHQHLLALLSASHEVEGFSTGEALLEGLAHGGRPDLVLLDWQLPGISGLEACRFIRGRYTEAELPVLMLTVRATRSDVEQGLLAGANDYVAKPFGDAELLARVRTLVRVGQQRRELARSLTRVTEVLESMGDLFFALDAEWRLALVNGKYEARTGLRREDALGQHFWTLYPDAAAPSSVRWREYHRCMDQRVAVHFEDHYAELGFWIDVRAFPTADGGIAVFVRDVTGAKGSEAAARRQVEFEQQLIGIVSHDLRNPLNVIVLASQVLQLRGQQDEVAAKAAQRIAKAAERANFLVRDLLDFTQARLGGGIHIAPEPADLHAVTRHMVDEVQAAHPDREIHRAQDGDGRGDWDAGRLGQVVQNLLTNALKYSRPGSVVRVDSRGDEAGVALSVHNEGEPIPEALQKLIFEPLQRGQRRTDSESRSIGLGLYIVKQVVDAHGGTVGVTSTAEAGTTFTVKLPRRRAAP